ncbi:MAG: DUF4190 domain-containing protein [Phycisphaerales bacterium]|nr:DUF4190 domain-containing protein [Planctomycetota bacterium]MBL6997420.1 DUF4190 domain-containing protein [Phycisphaerales bacterium]
MSSKKLNPWSMVAALCAVGLCPLFSIAAVLTGFRALVEIKARDDTRGARLAWVSILVGATITGLWGGGMLWWNTHVRAMIEQGPIQAITEGQAGSVEEFMSYFVEETSTEEAATFLHALHMKYGELIRGKLDENIDESSVDGANLFLGLVPIQAELQYLLVFEEEKMVRLTAHYDLFQEIDNNKQFTNSFAWFAIHDEKDGALVYPAHVTVEDIAQHE